MKKLIGLILLHFILQTGFSQSSCINGFIRSKIDSLGIGGAYVIMFEVNKTVMADKNGHFEVCGLNPGVYSFGVKFIGYKDTTILNINVKGDQTPKLVIYLSECKFHILGHSDICPICSSKDMVVPILYGIASKKMNKSAKKGKAYLGGTRTGCDPIWYCKKDLIEF